MVLFTVGLLLSDLENAKDWGTEHDQRPLEKMRNMSLFAKAPICIVLWAMVYASIVFVGPDEVPDAYLKGFGATALIILAITSSIC